MVGSAQVVGRHKHLDVALLGWSVITAMRNHSAVATYGSVQMGEKIFVMAILKV